MSGPRHAVTVVEQTVENAHIRILEQPILCTEQVCMQLCVHMYSCVYIHRSGSQCTPLVQYTWYSSVCTYTPVLEYCAHSQGKGVARTCTKFSAIVDLFLKIWRNFSYILPQAKGADANFR